MDATTDLEQLTDLDAQHLADQAEIERLRLVVRRLWGLARAGTGLDDAQVALRIGVEPLDTMNGK